MRVSLFLMIFFCAIAHGKPALLTTKDGTHAFMLSEKAVECSGNALKTLINSDEREMPTISLDAIATKDEQEAHEDLILFAQHLELKADAKEALAHATDDELYRQCAPNFKKLSLPTLARLFTYADFYGVLPLPPVLEQGLEEKIINECALLTAQLAANNKPSWLAHLLEHPHNKVLAQKIMQYHSYLFLAHGCDVIGKNQKAGLVLTLEDVLPALQKLQDTNTSFLLPLFDSPIRNRESIIAQLIETIEDRTFFAQHRELVAKVKNANSDATDYALRVRLTWLEQELVKKIDQNHGALTTQLTANNKPSWLAYLQEHPHNQVLAHKIMQHRAYLFCTYAVSVIGKNEQAGLVLTLEDVLPALQKLKNSNTSFLFALFGFGNPTQKKESTLTQLIATIDLKSQQPKN